MEFLILKIISSPEPGISITYNDRSGDFFDRMRMNYLSDKNFSAAKLSSLYVCEQHDHRLFIIMERTGSDGQYFIACRRTERNLYRPYVNSYKKFPATVKCSLFAKPLNQSFQDFIRAIRLNFASELYI